MISGSVKAGGRRARSREALAAKLMASVEALLTEGTSYTDLSVDEILERTDVPRSTFYYHFRDKGELLIAVSADATAQIVAVSEGLYRDGLHRSRREFTGAVQATAEAWLAHVPLMNALSEMAAYNPEVNAQFLAGWDARAEAGRRTHRRRAGRGVRPPGPAPRARGRLADLDGRTRHCDVRVACPRRPGACGGRGAGDHGLAHPLPRPRARRAGRKPSMTGALDDVDLNDPGLFADGPPHELFARMRDRGAGARNRPSGDQRRVLVADRVRGHRRGDQGLGDVLVGSARAASCVEGGILPKEFTSSCSST